MTGPTGTTADDELVKVAYANDQSEAELLQGLLRTVEVNSVVRRAPGFDVPEFLAAGPREVLVAASDVPVARDVLREGDPGDAEPIDPGDLEPPAESGGNRPSRRLLAGLLVAVALVGLVVCLFTDVIV
jgi:hypothetical protein